MQSILHHKQKITQDGALQKHSENESKDLWYWSLQIATDINIYR